MVVNLPHTIQDDLFCTISDDARDSFAAADAHGVADVARLDVIDQIEAGGHEQYAEPVSPSSVPSAASAPPSLKPATRVTAGVDL